VQKEEREEESGKPAEAMALREEHWALSTWAATPEERSPRAMAMALRLYIVEILKWLGRMIRLRLARGINIWAR
jgi:hypothetical protein